MTLLLKPISEGSTWRHWPDVLHSRNPTDVDMSHKLKSTPIFQTHCETIDAKKPVWTNTDDPVKKGGVSRARAASIGHWLNISCDTRLKDDHCAAGPKNTHGLPEDNGSRNVSCLPDPVCHSRQRSSLVTLIYLSALRIELSGCLKGRYTWTNFYLTEDRSLLF